MTGTDSVLFFGRKTALSLCALLLLGFVALEFIAWHTKKSRSQIEQIVEPTAVGDSAPYHFAPNAPDFDLQKPLIYVNGKPLFLAQIVRRKDSRMLRAGKDDSGKQTLYHWKHAKTEKEKATLYLKTDSRKLKFNHQIIQTSHRLFLELAPEPSPVS